MRSIFRDNRSIEVGDRLPGDTRAWPYLAAAHVEVFVPYNDPPNTPAIIRLQSYVRQQDFVFDESDCVDWDVHEWLGLGEAKLIREAIALLDGVDLGNVWRELVACKQKEHDAAKEAVTA